MIAHRVHGLADQRLRRDAARSRSRAGTPRRRRQGCPLASRPLRASCRSGSAGRQRRERPGRLPHLSDRHHHESRVHARRPHRGHGVQPRRNRSGSVAGETRNHTHSLASPESNHNRRSLVQIQSPAPDGQAGNGPFEGRFPSPKATKVATPKRGEPRRRPRGTSGMCGRCETAAPFTGRDSRAGVHTRHRGLLHRVRCPPNADRLTLGLEPERVGRAEQRHGRGLTCSIAFAGTR